METTSRIDRGRQDLLAWDASRPRNFYTSDPNLERILAARLGADWLAAERPHLSGVGEVSATDILRMSRDVNLDENLPRLERFSALGERTEEILFHPSYHEIGRIVWQTGVLARYREPGQETVQHAMNYLLSQHGEHGHACPLACTAGLIKVVMALGNESQRARWLPGLLSTEYSTRLHASQFLTEVQGGSDVGSNAVRAEPHLGGAEFRIFGEKWFCSVADASLFLMTARPKWAPEGTKGLGLFVVPRYLDGGRPNEFFIRRLKRKLGTRAMASAELDFEGAVAEPIGPLDRGFKNVIERVLDTSRVYNAIVCAASMRRAYVEAAGFAAHRQAFGQPIAAYPLVREALGTLRAESMAAAAASFRLVAQSDRLARGELDAHGIAARRVGVNVNKYWTSVRNTQMVRLALEVFGGNGAIESFSVIPQLYRDAMVLESWEGTHNTLMQQVLRDAERLGLTDAFVAELDDAVQRLVLPDSDAELVGAVRRGLGALKAPLARAKAGEVDQRFGRRIVDQMAVAQALVAMLEELSVTPDDGAKRGAIRFLAARDLAPELVEPAPLEAALFE
ncbi:acyl-CoA dehydrogenase family protein [Myxococcota bacterium]|nr:acyl-CoA dehydrogenase family protein [Myxococcota bacterium]